MIIQPAVPAQAGDVLKLIQQAQQYFKKAGIGQWQNGYPNQEVILSDINAGRTYILTDGSAILACAALCLDREPSYDAIYEGRWEGAAPYAAIHRVAVDDSLKGKGLASVLLDELEALCIKQHITGLRADTHKDNLSMQRLLHKCGFNRRGIIYLEDKTSRIAYEKLL